MSQIEAKWRRLSTYEPAKAIKICERIAEGETLSAICEDEGMPQRSTFRRWMVRQPELRKAYEAARELQSHSLFDEALDLVRRLKTGELENAQVNAYRVALEQLRWSAAKLNPAQYGEKQNPSGVLNVQIITSLDLGKGQQLGPAPGENLYNLKVTSPALIDASASSEMPIQAEEGQSRPEQPEARHPSQTPSSGDAG